MSDLIERDKAIDAIKKLPNAGTRWIVSAESVFEVLMQLPSADRPSAIDLSSVYSTAYKSGYEKGKTDRPQGKWKAKSFHECFCDNCGFLFDIMKCDFLGNMKHCPDCGARMKGADDE